MQVSDGVPVLGLIADGSPFAQRLRSSVIAVFADVAKLVDLTNGEAGGVAVDAAAVLAERFEAAILQDLLIAGVGARRIVTAFEHIEELESTTLNELGLRSVAAPPLARSLEPLVVAVREALRSLDGPADRDRVHEVLGQLALQPVGALQGLLFKRRLAGRVLAPAGAIGMTVQEMKAGARAAVDLVFGGVVGPDVCVLHATAGGLADLDQRGHALFTQEILGLALHDDRVGLDLVDGFLRHATARLGSRETYRPNLLLFWPRLGTLRALLSRGADFWVLNRDRIPKVSLLPPLAGELNLRTKGGIRVTRSLSLVPGDVVGLLPSLDSTGEDRARRRESTLQKELLAAEGVLPELRDVEDGEHEEQGVLVRWGESSSASAESGEWR